MSDNKKREEKLDGFLDKYENKLNVFADRSERIIDGYVKGIEKSVDFFDAFFHKVIKPNLVLKLAGGVERFIEWYIRMIKHTYTLVRWSTIPWNYFWVKGYKKITAPKEKNPLDKPGIHFVTAKQGGGKSSIAFFLAEKGYIENGKGAYINVNMENARLDPISGKWIKHHRQFDLWEYWGIVEDPDTGQITLKQKKKFNTKYFDTIILDEWLAMMNHRLNNTKSYKEIFVAMINALVQCRHQGIKRVIILSQINTTDTQLEEAFANTHKVKVKLDIPYKQWVKDGMFTSHILGWQLRSFGERDKNDTKKQKKVKQRTKIMIEDEIAKIKLYDNSIKPERALDIMKYFNSLNQSDNYDKLPNDVIKTTEGVLY